MLSLLSDTPRHINLVEVGIGLFGLRGPMHLCACVSEERSNGEGAGSQALSLLSDSIFWSTKAHTQRQYSRYTKRANHTDTTPTYTRAGHVIQRIARSATKQATCPCTDVFLQHCLLSE